MRATRSRRRASAQPGWAARTPYNRGQILYRIAEMLEGRRSEFAEAVRVGEGGTQAAALAQVDAAVDRWVWYSGWADKVGAVFGGANPVSGPFFNFSVPQPTGVVALVSPVRPSLLGLVSVLAPVVVSGNTAVVIADADRQRSRRRRSARSWPPPTCPAVWSTCSPGRRPTWPPGWRRTRASTGST